MIILYGIIAVMSFLVACGYFVFAHRKEKWLALLCFSVFVANIGYFLLAISKTLDAALMANRLAYLGCVFLPLCMLAIIMEACKVKYQKKIIAILVGISLIVFFVVASQGYLDLYYSEVTLEFVNGTAKLNKVYGPLHNVYYLYLAAYFGSMIGIVAVAIAKKKITSCRQTGILVAVVFLNIVIWLVEQFIDSDFEFLSVSYIISEILLMLLYGIIYEYEALYKKMESAYQYISASDIDLDKLATNWHELKLLSNREKDVLMKMLEDKKRKIIAEELFISENTVKKHVTSIFSKLNVSSRDELFERIRKSQC